MRPLFIFAALLVLLSLQISDAFFFPSSIPSASSSRLSACRIKTKTEKRLKNKQYVKRLKAKMTSGSQLTARDMKLSSLLTKEAEVVKSLFLMTTAQDDPPFDDPDLAKMSEGKRGR